MKINIKETNLQPQYGMSLSKRYATEKIVIHHTGSKVDTDQGAVQIDNYHKNGNHWTMIGYHFVVRKDGTIERGRPEWAVGSHAQGHNSNSIGIHLSGDFNAAKPTEKQIEMCAMLIAYLCDKYNIPTDRQHIIGHDECYAGVGKTDGAGCPGVNLQSQLDTISGKANWYRYPPKPTPDAVVKDVITIKSANAINEDTKAKIKELLNYADVVFVIN